MIASSFIIKNTTEEKAEQLLQQIADLTKSYINKIHPKAILAGTPWIYKRSSNKPGEPPLILITRTLEHYLWVSAEAADEAPHKTWIFDIHCPNHVIAIPDRDYPKIHILKPDQVSTLFRNLAQAISKLVNTEVSFNDDHTRTGIIYQKGKATKEEHW